MDIPGIKDLRLLAQQPVALIPGGGMDISSERAHFIEVTFDNGSIINVPVSKYIHDTFLDRLRGQGTKVEQRVSARASVALPGILGVASQESYLPLDRPVGPAEVETALREAVEGDPAPSTTATTIPATPLALHVGDPCRIAEYDEYVSELVNEAATEAFEELEPPTPKLPMP